MKIYPFFLLSVTFLFAFVCTYALFDKVREADSFLGKKYEARDTEDLYAGKRSNLDDVLVSAALFPPFRDSFFEFLPTYFSLNTHLVTILFGLRR
jgi:hypothetical protein